MAAESDTAGVAAPPPLIHAVGLTAGLLLNAAAPVGRVPAPMRAIGVLPLLAGISFIGLSLREMRRARTNVSPYKPTEALVEAGPYRLSRNPPQYIGYVMLWTGAGLARRSWRGLAAAVTYAAAVRAWVPVEERHLSREFGDEYRHWAQRRSRWLGLPKANGPRSSA